MRDFLLVSIIGFAISLVTLVISHDLLGLTSRLSDDISANGVGPALGTAFRFVTCKHVVFRVAPGGGPPVSGLPVVSAVRRVRRGI